VGRVLAGGRDIRAAGPLLQVLTEVALVDQHAHGLLRSRPTLDEFRGLFSESPDPRQWPHVATGVTYRRAIRELAEFLGCDPAEEAVLERRNGSDFDEYAATLMRATNTEAIYVDDGYPTGETIDWPELGELADSESRPVLRLEDRGERAAEETAAARDHGYAALKTVAAYRGGLDRASEHVVAALEANEATGKPLPLQVHCGFGDSDLHLWRADPSLLKPLIERFRETRFVLLHCYPFVREAGWLAHVYGHVYVDLSLTIPHVWRGPEMLLEALELAPASKLLYASDASRAPELYYLAAKWWREALAEVLPELFEDDAEAAGRRILRENALEVYGLSSQATLT
jgi:uncharacterized protein